MSIILKNLAVGYYGKSVLNDINAEIQKGEVAVLLGKNGSGKTTLLKTILNFNPRISGDIIFDLNDIESYSPNELSRNLAVVLSQRPANLHMKMEDFLMHGRYPYHSFQIRPNQYERKLVEETIHFLKLEDVIDMPVNELSDGNFKKLAIARAIVQDTDYILLDEPLAHLDIGNQQILLEILQDLAHQKQKGIIFTTHDWSQSMPIADQLWLIQNRNFKAGPTEELALNNHIISYFANDNFEFDFELNQYKLKSNKEIKKVQLIKVNANPELVFWLERALSRKGFEIVENAELNIEVHNKEMKVIKDGNTFQSQFITEILDKI